MPTRIATKKKKAFARTKEYAMLLVVVVYCISSMFPMSAKMGVRTSVPGTQEKERKER